MYSLSKETSRAGSGIGAWQADSKAPEMEISDDCTARPCWAAEDSKIAVKRPDFSGGSCTGRDQVRVQRRPPERLVRTITAGVFLTASMQTVEFSSPFFVIGTPSCEQDVEVGPKYHSSGNVPWLGILCLPKRKPATTLFRERPHGRCGSATAMWPCRSIRWSWMDIETIQVASSSGPWWVRCGLPSFAAS
ncbi:hypothetical protein BDW62DRAFT_162721 [Aspergillus aurantiobrunneus]